VDFETMSRQFDRDIAAKENRERLWSFSFKLDEMTDDIATIRKGDGNGRGADWINVDRIKSVTLSVVKVSLTALRLAESGEPLLVSGLGLANKIVTDSAKMYPRSARGCQASPSGTVRPTSDTRRARRNRQQSPRAYNTGPVFWVARAISVSPPFQYASSSVNLSPHSAQSERSLPAE
jgi:hypothetical protein